MNDSFTKEEKAAMRALAAERRKKFTPAEHAAEVAEKYSEMAPGDRAIGEAIHDIVMAAAPNLEPRTWYGMPAYFLGAKVICFFQDGGKFKSRYCTFGFQDAAQIDDGPMWATSFAVLEVNAAVGKQIRELVSRATNL